MADGGIQSEALAVEPSVGLKPRHYMSSRGDVTASKTHPTDQTPPTDPPSLGKH